jgi:hypothetical protein
MADDVISAWLEIWGAVRLSLVGMALCAIGWLWALATSLRIIRESRNAEAAGTPPRLT